MSEYGRERAGVCLRQTDRERERGRETEAVRVCHREQQSVSVFQLARGSEAASERPHALLGAVSQSVSPLLCGGTS